MRSCTRAIPLSLILGVLLGRQLQSSSCASRQAQALKQTNLASGQNEVDKYGLEYCREEYTDLYVRLGDKICDIDGIENGDGSWCRNLNQYVGGDTGLAAGLYEVFSLKKAVSINDFGAGGGWYAEFISSKGFEVRAYDGAVGTKVTPLTEKNAWKLSKATDTFMNTVPFSNVIKIPLSFYHGDMILTTADWSYSIEVGEHLPKQYEEIFVLNLVNHSRYGIILTWAVPGQKGHGHVNPKSRDEVVALFTVHGFKYDIALTNLVKNKCGKDYLAQNVLVLVR